MGLKKDIQELRQQGYNDAQMKGSLTEKGHSLQDINHEIATPVQKQETPKDNHKLLILIASILLIIILANIIYYFYSSTEHYSDNPKKWIDEVNGSYIIDVEKANEGKGYVDQAGEQQNTELNTVFSNEGWYQGNYFQKFYELNGKTIMRINNNMTPNDGVIEGYVIEKLENDEIYAYIFLDSDWRKSLPNTEVFWGGNYQNNISFDFSNEISDGIYMIKLKEDMNRFYLNYSIHSGGFYVGELKDDNTSTLISFS